MKILFRTFVKFLHFKSEILITPKEASLNRIILFLFVSLLSTLAKSENSNLNLYTPQLVKDYQNKGAKGAVQLVWQKNQLASEFEVQISNGDHIYKFKTEDNFKHVMLYFNKNYQWRVLDLNNKNIVSNWRPLNVIKASIEKEAQLKNDNDIESIVMDFGAN
jgi:hypothetical protein